MTGAVSGARDAAAVALVERLRAGDVAALARAITLVENEAPGACEILSEIDAVPSVVPVVGVTGPPGVGKSTLIDAFVAELRRRERRVSILAIDPSSPLTGGAILGDRVRMARHMDDAGVFVRSLASRGALGGLSRTAATVLRVMAAAGPDVIIVETVGAGQSDIEIDRLADARVVVSAPGLGDGIQAVKAGILEIADILVVNKADLPGSDKTVRQLQAMVQLRPKDAPPVCVIAVSAVKGTGIAELADSVVRYEQCPRRPVVPPTSQEALAAAILDLTRQLLRERLDGLVHTELPALCARVLGGEMDLRAAAQRLMDALAANLCRPND